MSTPVLTAKTPVPPPSTIMSDRHASPILTSAPVKSENFGWAAILSVISAILFAVLLVMQWMEYSQIWYI